MASPTTTENLLELLRRSSLIEPVALEEYLKENPGLPADPTRAARKLVSDGLLTAFQASQLLVGRHRGFLLGPYKVLEPLGAGGMGAVYLCEQVQLRRRVAVKVMTGKYAADRSSVERFYREARAVAALDHPNIVRAYDVNQANNQHYLAMEYIEGDTLEALVRKNGPLPFRQAADYVIQTAMGLQHAHERGLVHRDIKPANLLVDKQGTLKILDMGLARFFKDEEDNLTKQLDGGAVLGTADYLSPEQALDSTEVDIRSDIYSLGATFYMLVTGRPPFGGSTTEKLLAHQLKEPLALHQLQTTLPQGLSNVVQKMMAKDPSQRYQTPAELILALAPWSQTWASLSSSASMPAVSPPSITPMPVASQPILAPMPVAPPPTITPTPSPPFPPSKIRKPKSFKKKKLPFWKRRENWAILGGGAALVLAVGIVSGLLLSRPSSSSTPSSQAANEQRLPPATQPQVASRGTDDEPTKTSNKSKNRSKDETAKATSNKTKKSKTGDGSGTTGSKGTAKGSLDGLRVIRLFEGHTGAVESVAVSRDGQRILSGGQDAKLRLWDLESGQLLQIMSGHRGVIYSLAFSADGSRALSAGGDNMARLWDLKTGQELLRFQRHTNEVTSVAFSPDGRRALSASGDQTIRLWELENGQLVRQFNGHTARVWSAVFSPDGQYILSGSEDRSVRLWEVASGQEIRQFKGHQGQVRRVAFSPDGQRALSAGWDATMRLWDVATGQEVHRFDSKPFYVEDVSFSPDGMFALSSEGPTQSGSTAADFGVRLWDLRTDQLLSRSGVSSSKCLPVQFSADGRYAVSGGADKLVRLWQMPPFTAVRTSVPGPTP
jgi:serine/threonine protein kinase